MICVECHQEKFRAYSGNRRIDGRKIYVDDTGKQWTGNTCPTCKYAGKQAKPRKKHRHCKRCRAVLTADRYFNCIRCIPVLPSENPFLVPNNTFITHSQ